MRAKLEAHAYCSVADLERDFDLMVSNCLKYNSKDTMFHKAALQLREVGGAVLRHAHRQAQSIGLDPSSGLHLPDSHNKHGFNQCSWDDGEPAAWTGIISILKCGAQLARKCGHFFVPSKVSKECKECWFHYGGFKLQNKENQDTEMN